MCDLFGRLGAEQAILLGLFLVFGWLLAKAPRRPRKDNPDGSYDTEG